MAEMMINRDKPLGFGCPMYFPCIFHKATELPSVPGGYTWQVGAEAAGGVSPYARKLRETIRHLEIPRDTSGHWLQGWISLISSLIPALSFGDFYSFLRIFFSGISWFPRCQSGVN